MFLPVESHSKLLKARLLPGSSSTPTSSARVGTTQTQAGWSGEGGIFTELGKGREKRRKGRERPTDAKYSFLRDFEK